MDQRPPTVPIPSELLLAHAGSLRTLARRILGDEAAAEDVVQETWVVALERPPGRRERLPGWLGTVARTLALKRLRADGRRREREERAARGTRLPSTSDTAEKRQALRRMTDAVLTLEEPYQTAILLRFFDGLPPRAIAQQLDVPVATVKSRVARGLDRLRARLEEDARRDGTTLRRALAFLTGPAPVAAPVETPHGSGSAAAAAGAGALLMGAQVKGVAAVAAAVLVGTFAWQGLGGRAVEPTRPDAVEERVAARPDAVLKEVPVEELAADARQPETRREAAAAFEQELVDATEPAAEDPYLFELEGIVLDDYDLPLPGAQLYAGPIGVGLNHLGEADESGRFRFSWRGDRSGLELAVAARDGGAWSGLRRIALRDGRSSVALQVTESQASEPTRASLLVRLADGQSDGDFVIAFGPAPLPWLNRAPSFEPDEEGFGAFRSDSLDGGCPGKSTPLALQQLLHQPEWRSTIDLAAHGGAFTQALLAGRLDEVLPPATHATFAGTVTDAEGEPVTAALVVLGREPGGSEIRTVTGEDGAFLFEELDEGTWHARAGGGDHGVALRTFVAAPGHAEVWTPSLDRGAELVGRLVHSGDGSPLGSWRVDVRCVDPPYEDFALSGDDGVFRIPNAPDRPLEVSFRPVGATLPAEVVHGVWPGGRKEEVFELDGTAAKLAKARLEVLDHEGKPIEGAEVRLWNLDAGLGLWLDSQDEGTFFASQKVTAGRYGVEVRVPRREPVSFGPVHLAPGDEVDLGVVDIAPPGRAHFRGEADAEGVLARWRFALWRRAGGVRTQVFALSEHFPPDLAVAAGAYELELLPNGEHEDVQRLAEAGELPSARRFEFEVQREEKTRTELQVGAQEVRAAPAPPRAPKPASTEPPVANLSQEELAALLRKATFEQLAWRRDCASCH
ncbi:MAG: sigma-70 family RNA polymerase sigma factor [Planctomycetota bacterium]